MCLRVLVSGTVQGVGYRAFARRAARELGIHGEARNLEDGRVEVHACCADSAALQAFIERLQQGPQWARVSAIEASEAPCCPDRDFSIA
jgi:acylphosphatase